MTSAKPYSMAAQTDAPDDLIAELARLMADEARGDGKAPEQTKPQPGPIRIPGGEMPTPAPRPDYSTGATVSQQHPQIRVPGTQPVAPAATPRPAASFDMGRQPAGPTSPIQAAPVAVKAAEAPVAVEPQPAEPVDQPELDRDSLADLIAAELASDMGTPATPMPAANGPARGEDNFGIPPVFGFGSPQTPTPPSAAAVTIVEPEPMPVTAPSVSEPKPETSGHSDALRDIERLVEPALQVTPPAPTPSPALRSLATPTLPPETERRVEPNLKRYQDAGSVDDAILAAAAATGARVEWVDGGHEDNAAPYDDEPRPERRRRAPVFGMSRALAGPLVAVALLAVAGVGLYFMLGQSSAPEGPAPLIAADTAAVKEIPEPVETAAQQSVVFNEISGANTGAEEQIVSRDQADEEAVTEAASVALGNSGVLEGAEDGTVDPNTDGLVNRKVRTVTVRPDGTIVSGEDSLAGASILPVDRPNVPDVPGADFSTPDLIANGGAATGTTTETAALPAVPAATTTTTDPTVVPIQPGAVVPVVDATGTAIPGRTTATPLQRPTDLAAASASATTTSPTAATPANAPAATTAAAVPTQAAAAPVPTGSAGAYVQLSSQRSEQAARESAQAIASRYGPLFGGANLEVQRVDLGERGIFFRVLAPAADRGTADNLCTNLKAAGGECFLL